MTTKEIIKEYIDRNGIGHPTDIFYSIKDKMKGVQLQDIIDIIEEKGYILNEYNILVKKA